jgi:hypothetical protein
MSEQSIKKTRRTALEFVKRSQKEVTEEDIQERLERKMEGLLAAKYHECLLIFDCVPDLLEYLKMFRDKTIVASEYIDCNYSKMIGFLLQELDLIEISRTYLSDLDEITEEGLEMLNVEDGPLYKKMIERPFK